MSIVLIVSILIRCSATAWSLVLLRRLHDWRIGFLTVMLGLMTLRQVLTFVGERGADISGFQMAELPGLIVSIMALLATIAFGEILQEQTRARQTLKRETWVLDQVHDAVISTDLNGIVQTCNPAAERLSGYSAEELIGANVALFYFPEDAAQVPRTLLKSLVDTDELETCIRYRRKDGEELFVDLRLSLLRNEDGVAVGITACANDVTERKRARDALGQSEALNRSIISSLPWRIAVIDRRGEITALNEAWNCFACAARAGWCENGDVGVNYLKLCREATGDSCKNAQEAAAGIENVLSGERKDYYLEYHCPSPTEDYWFALYVTPLRSEVGGAVVSHVDITQRKIAEAKSRRQQAELAHVARLSTAGEMASSLAHELNQPLTSIANYCDAARDMAGSIAQPPENLLRAITRAGKQARRAGQIVRNLRKYVRKDVAERSRIDINSLVERTMELTGPEARDHGVTVNLELYPDLPPASLNEVEIEQVLVNLATNSVEAMATVDTRPRELTITTDADETAIRVTVHDTGPGLNGADSDQLLEPFNTSKSQGMGLGLSISRSIVEAHGGRLWAESTAGAGTTFHFTLPIEDINP